MSSCLERFWAVISLAQTCQWQNRRWWWVWDDAFYNFASHIHSIFIFLYIFVNERFLVPTGFCVWLISFRHLLSVIQSLWKTSSISLSAMFINHFDGVLQMGLVVQRLLCSSFPPSIHTSSPFFHSQYSAQGRTFIISLSAIHPSVHPSPFLSLNINCSSPQWWLTIKHAYVSEYS